MMKKKELILGLLIGIMAALFGSFLFLIIFTKFNDLSDLFILKNEGVLGKIITLGALLNLLLFFICIKTQRENMAKGILLATILLAIFTTLL
jgi:hypothetical protein